MKTIFVSIASYRDTDLQNTLDSLFANAAHPDRVFVGIFLQIADELDNTTCLVKPRPNVRIDTVDARAARGPGWARSKVQAMWKGEDFFFQVDSHMRFAKNWDELLCEMWAKCPGDKAVLSTYPLPFTPPNDLSADKYVTIKPKGFDVDGVFLQNSGMVPLTFQGLARNYFISAGMLFGPSSMIKEVPVDPYIFFTGEEITTALRLWTHGYDIYVPNKAIAYHNYAPAPERPRIWQDPTITYQYKKSSRERVLWLCGVREAAPIGNEIAKYSLGTTRTLKEYEELSGVDFTNQLYFGKKIVSPK